jgi:hypothetical protein
MSSNSTQQIEENAMLRPAGRRVNPDSIGTLRFTIAGAIILAGTSFLVSFAGLTSIAVWTGIPAWMGWALPVFIDMAIIVYAMAILIHRSRGEKTTASWVSLTGFTLVSVFANGAHALSVPQSEQWHAIVGAVLAALAPIAVFSAVEELGRLVIDQAPTKQAKKVAKRNAAASPTTVSPRVPPPQLYLPLVSPSNVTAITTASISVDPDLASWAATQPTSAITAVAIGKLLGVSSRTGQKRLNDLRVFHPEVFRADPQQKAVDA